MLSTYRSCQAASVQMARPFFFLQRIILYILMVHTGIQGGIAARTGLTRRRQWQCSIVTPFFSSIPYNIFCLSLYPQHRNTETRTIIRNAR